jgi:hypothetical protein
MRTHFYWRGTRRPFHAPLAPGEVRAAPDHPCVRVSQDVADLIAAIAARRGIPKRRVLDLVLADLVGR